MANAAKLLSRMRTNPRDWRIEDLEVVAGKYSVRYRQQGTSHVVIIHESLGWYPCRALARSSRFTSGSLSH